MIEAEKLTKYYGNRAAVRDLTFNVEKGEIVGLLGPNGAGKTTTMRMLTGYLPADGGRAVVAGYDVAEKPMEVRKRLGYMPETVPLYTEMPVNAYLDFIAKIRGVPGKGRKRRIEEVMEMCRIADVSTKIIGKLSRGYRQRVGLAQAIIHNPQVIILDEPTVGLDPRQIIEIRKVIRDLAGNHSMILSTHILPEVSALCDRVVIVNRGRVLVEDTLANLERRESKGERLRLEIRGPAEQIETFLQNWPGVLGLDLPGQVSLTISPLDSEVEVPADAEMDTATEDTEDEDRPAQTEAALARSADPTAPHTFDLKVEPGQDLREALASAIVSNGWGLLELKTVTPSLEEIFVQLITEDLAKLEEEEAVEAGGYSGDEEDLARRPFAAAGRKDEDEMDEPELVAGAEPQTEEELEEDQTTLTRRGDNPVEAKARIFPVEKSAGKNKRKRKAAPLFLTDSDDTSSRLTADLEPLKAAPLFPTNSDDTEDESVSTTLEAETDNNASGADKE